MERNIFKRYPLEFIYTPKGFGDIAYIGGDVFYWDDEKDNYVTKENVYNEANGLNRKKLDLLFRQKVYNGGIDKYLSLPSVTVGDMRYSSLTGLEDFNPDEEQNVLLRRSLTFSEGVVYHYDNNQVDFYVFYSEDEYDGHYYDDKEDAVIYHYWYRPVLVVRKSVFDMWSNSSIKDYQETKVKTSDDELPF